MLLALALALGASPPGHGQNLLPSIQDGARRGEAHAQFELGESHVFGHWGLPRDVPLGLDWMRKAAAQGHIRAQYGLGHIYAMGRVVPQDEAQAAAWYRQAVDNPAADDDAARFKAAAQFQLGTMLIEGRGAPQDAAQGMALLHQAAASGDPYFQVSLGEHYLQGRRVARDDRQALSWFRKAADKNDPRGQAALGRAYAEGRGVPVDRREAARWYLAAARGGAFEARLPLALAYHRGDGLARDDREAYLWVIKASETAMVWPEVEVLRLELEKGMTPKQLAAARRRADAYRPGASATTSRSP